MLFRTPATPLVLGPALEVAGGFFAEPLMAVLFAGSIVAWAAAARAFGARTALLVAVALLVYPAYGLMFHELSSEPVFAFAFAVWSLLVVRAAQAPSVGRFTAAGLGLSLLAFVRPGNALLVVFALFVFAIPGSGRQRTRWATAFVGAALVPLAAWAVLNGVRFGDYALARGGNAVIPFYRAFITDKIVAPDNGAASRRLADAVQQHLLTRNPYKAYHVTLHRVFTSGSFRIHEDLYVLSDRVFGWDANYAILRKAGLEAVKQHPGKYTSGVLHTIWQQLSKSYFRAPPAAAAAPAQAGAGGSAPAPPTEGEPIPAGQNAWISRPDNCITDVWTSATAHHFTFCNTRVHRQFNEVVKERDELFAAVPDRSGSGTLRLWLNRLSRWFPRLILWIALGLAALVLRRPRGGATLVALALAALFVIAFNALGLFADPHFALPVAPALVLFGAGALLAPRSR
jgi:hypothetical protein